MMNKTAWFLAALLMGACAIPDISLVEQFDDAKGGSSGKSGADNRGGTKSESQGGNSGEPEPPGGGEAGTDAVGGTGITPGGGRPPTAGSDTGPMPGKTAFGKFCNAVVLAGEPVALDLRVGEGSNLVHIVADSGTCSPIVDRPCQPIQSGSVVPVGVYDLDGVALFTAQIRVEPGDGWLFTFYFNEDANPPAAELAGNPGASASECSAIDFDDLFPAGS